MSFNKLATNLCPPETNNFTKTWLYVIDSENGLFMFSPCILPRKYSVI